MQGINNSGYETLSCIISFLFVPYGHTLDNIRGAQLLWDSLSAWLNSLHCPQFINLFDHVGLNVCTPISKKWPKRRLCFPHLLLDESVLKDAGYKRCMHFGSWTETVSIFGSCMHFRCVTPIDRVVGVQALYLKIKHLSKVK